VLATTDDPVDDLSAHRELASLPGWTARVAPTFRPDRYLEAGRPGWAEAVRRLGTAADTDTGDYRGFVAALEQRRRYFIEHGAFSADHGHQDAHTEPMALPDAERVFRLALTGEATAAETVAFRRHMVLEMARMSCDDGLVMTLHPGAHRDHHTASARAFGPDTGSDIPQTTEYTRALRPLLERYGHTPTCTWCCSPSTSRCGRASSRRWQASTRRSTSALPGGSSMLPTRSSGSGRR
jgi:glucuronate isomerase